jgi:outer membrane protein OmpA-like peptidoglycan-associated protein
MKIGGGSLFVLGLASLASSTFAGDSWDGVRDQTGLTAEDIVRAVPRVWPRPQICLDKVATCPTVDDRPPFRMIMAKFWFGSDELSEAARAELDQFAKALLDPLLRTYEFDIEGYTDASGDEARNVDLSVRRATAVARYLSSQGVEASRLIIKGFGSERLAATDRYSSDNRRVEIHLAGSSSP